MSVLCPRCREPIQADWDHCHQCGLTVAQLDKLVRSATLARLSSETGAGASRSHVPDASPAYYAQPVYGEGPVRRSTGYAPPAPGVSDLRRHDTIIVLTDGEAKMVVTGSGATTPAPPPPRPPVWHEHRRVSPGHKVELGLTLALAVAVIFVAILVFL
ncbi:MAG: zinc ribbon domain-containing protein [Actinobacteria bacterium]|nr:zinc ribbon domain-containing protein [Actinomycetota bacterium]